MFLNFLADEFPSRVNLVSSHVFEESLNSCNSLISQFSRYLNEILKYQADVENIKGKLAQRSDFPINEIFSYFDKSKSGKIGMEEFKRGTSLFDMKLSEQELSFLLRRFSRDGRNYLTSQEFYSMFLPKNKGNIQSRVKLVKND